MEEVILCGLCQQETYYTHISGVECQVCSNDLCPLGDLPTTAGHHYSISLFVRARTALTSTKPGENNE